MSGCCFSVCASTNVDEYKTIRITLTDEATFQLKMGNIQYTPESFSDIDVETVSLVKNYYDFGCYVLELTVKNGDGEYIKSVREKLSQREDVEYVQSNVTSIVGIYFRDHISINVGDSVVLPEWDYTKDSYSNWTCDNESVVAFDNGKITGLKLGYAYIRGTSGSGVGLDVFTYKVTVDPVKEHSKTTNIVGKKSATYFTKGYTGDKVCKDCDEVVVNGKQIEKLTLKEPTVTVKAGKKKLKIKYKKVTDATGFQVKYKMKGKTFTKTYKTNKAVTKTIKNLKKGTFKVQVRAFVKQGKNKAYSNFTKVKTVKIF